MWHVSSRSGVATVRTAIHLLLTYLLTYLHHEVNAIPTKDRIYSMFDENGFFFTLLYFALRYVFSLRHYNRKLSTSVVYC